MPHKDTFNSYLQSELDQLEILRKTIANQYIVFYLLAIITTVGLILGWTYSIAVPIIGLICFVFIFYKINKLNQSYKEFKWKYKNDILQKVLQKRHPELVYQPINGITEDEFNSSYLFDKVPDRYYAEDLMTTKADKTAFYFSEIYAQYKTETHTKHGKQTQWHKLFKGILFVADFNKHFHGTTMVRPKDFGFNFSKWTGLSIFQKSSQSIVELENTEFNKEFVCYSNDQVEARYILTPKLMEEIVALNARCNYTISLSFTQEKVYIAFPLLYNYFEVSLFKKITKSKTLESDLEVIDFVYEIIEDLDLNTRIWTKS